MDHEIEEESSNEDIDNEVPLYDNELASESMNSEPNHEDVRLIFLAVLKVHKKTTLGCLINDTYKQVVLKKRTWKGPETLPKQCTYTNIQDFGNVRFQSSLY